MSLITPADRKLRALPSVATLSLAAVAVGSMPTSAQGADAPPGVSTTATPRGDAYVSSSWANGNTGTFTSLRISAATTSTKKAFLTFALPERPAGARLTSATLALHSSRSNGTVRISPVVGGFTESTLTWRNQPTQGSTIALATLKVGTYSATDITTLLADGPGTVSVVVDAPPGADTRDLYVDARESAYAPRLMVTYGDCSGTNAAGLPNCAGQTIFGAATGLAGAHRTKEELFRDAERRYGRGIPIWRFYAEAGTVPFAPGSDSTVAALAHLAEGGIVQYNWKPNPDWSKATGADGVTNTMIDRTAENIKAAAPGRVWLTLHHEPDDEIAAGSVPGCRTDGATPGNTPENYVAMWRHVHDRFAALGVTNVTWVTGYMGFKSFACDRNVMWPGDDIVDITGFDRYWGARASPTFDSAVGATYDWFMANSAPGHDYGSKPFALMETGMSEPDAAQALAYQGYRDLAAAVTNGTYPNLKAILIWDSNGDNGKCVRTDMAGFDTPDPVESAEFQAAVNVPNFTVAPDLVP